MSEVRKVDEIPIPLVNYLNLLKEGKSPYYDIVKHLLIEMEKHYTLGDRPEIVYTINPRILERELEKKIQSEKLTTMNICRTLLAFFYGSGLEKGKDFYVTTSSRGKRNYHIIINDETLPKLKNFLYSSISPIVF